MKIVNNICGLIIIATLIFITSCSKDDKVEDQFSITFNPNEYETHLYELGESSVIEVNSNIGEPEEISLLLPHNNVIFDGSINKLTWNEGLPLGLTTVTVKAVKGNTETTTQVAISNIFEGDFQGGVNQTDETDPVIGDFRFYFENDDTFRLFLGNATSSIPGTYSLNINNNTILFTYVTGGNTYVHSGLLTYSAENSPSISGDWYLDTVDPENRIGYFEILWSDSLGD